MSALENNEGSNCSTLSLTDAEDVEMLFEKMPAAEIDKIPHVQKELQTAHWVYEGDANYQVGVLMFTCFVILRSAACEC